MVKHNPDDRRDNVDRIQNNIDHTIQNIDNAEERIAISDDPKQRKALKDKNERRKDALNGMRNEIRDEATDKNNKYK